MLLWQKHTKEKQLQQAYTLRQVYLILIILSNIGCIAILGYLLAQIPTQNTPYIDATTNILAITATILMLLRFKEQWWFYITLNIFSILMWAIRTMMGVVMVQ
jgi:nicotinamide mononucleotide transporter